MNMLSNIINRNGSILFVFVTVMGLSFYKHNSYFIMNGSSWRVEVTPIRPSSSNKKLAAFVLYFLKKSYFTQQNDVCNKHRSPWKRDRTPVEYLRQRIVGLSQ